MLTRRLEGRGDRPGRCGFRIRYSFNRRMNLAIGASGLRPKVFRRSSGIEEQCPQLRHSITIRFICQYLVIDPARGNPRIEVLAQIMLPPHT